MSGFRTCISEIPIRGSSADLIDLGAILGGFHGVHVGCSKAVCLASPGERPHRETGFEPLLSALQLHLLGLKHKRSHPCKNCGVSTATGATNPTRVQLHSLGSAHGSAAAASSSAEPPDQRKRRRSGASDAAAMRATAEPDERSVDGTVDQGKLRFST